MRKYLYTIEVGGYIVFGVGSPSESSFFTTKASARESLRKLRREGAAVGWTLRKSRMYKIATYKRVE